MMFLLNCVYGMVFVILVLVCLLIEAGIVALEIGLAILEGLVGLYWRVKDYSVCKFKKTFKPVKLFARRVANMVLSRYELSFKQETLFNVRIKTSGDAIPKQCWIVGTVRPGSFDFELEPIKYDTPTVVEKVEVSHMCLPCKTFYGPIYMMHGDDLKVTYGRVLSVR